MRRCQGMIRKGCVGVLMVCETRLSILESKTLFDIGEVDSLFLHKIQISNV